MSEQKGSLEAVRKELRELIAEKEVEAKEAQKYANGFREGAMTALSVFSSMQEEPHAISGGEVDCEAAQKIVDHFIYELCKELDISSAGIRGNIHMSDEEKASVLAKHIREIYGESQETAAGNGG